MYQTRTYDRESNLAGWPGDPVVVLVVDGTHDVSRLVAALNHGTVEQLDVGQKLVRQLRRHNTGRAALQLLRDHGGPDFTEPPMQLPEKYRVDDSLFALAHDQEGHESFADLVDPKHWQELLASVGAYLYARRDGKQSDRARDELADRFTAIVDHLTLEPD